MQQCMFIIKLNFREFIASQIKVPHRTTYPAIIIVMKSEYILSYFACVYYKYVLQLTNITSYYTYHFSVCFSQLTKSLCMAVHMGTMSLFFVYPILTSRLQGAL